MDSTLQITRDMDKLQVARNVKCDSSDLSSYIQTGENIKNFTIISQNIRSIYRNFDDFLITLSGLSIEPDIVVLTECRLNPNKAIPQINNYKSYQTTNQFNQNDGVVVYIKDVLKFK